MSMVLKMNLTWPLFFCALITQGQQSTDQFQSDKSNHVVIGAFSSLENATRFVEGAKSMRYEAQSEMNPARELYYVYVLKTDNRVQAFAEARKLRKESKYWDTWVFYGSLGQPLQVKTTAAAESSAEPGGGNSPEPLAISKEDEIQAAEVKAFSMGEEPTGIDLDKMIATSKTQSEKDQYEVLQEVKATATRFDETTKVIIFKDDEEGRKTLLALGYEIEKDQPITGFFDSKNNILAINASEAKSDEVFHEGLMPVVKFLRKKNPEMFETLAKEASAIKHPTRGVTYGELYASDEESLAYLMADVERGYFENSPNAKVEAIALMSKMLKALGVANPEIATNPDQLKVTAHNLAIAVREATGFDADGNRKFRFNIFNTRNLKSVKGEVDLVNEAGRKLVSYPGNELVKVQKADASGNIILACEVLGYRKLLVKLNYDNPFLASGIERGDDEEAIVSFGLVRLEKGDIAVMYNVYFFKDAAIMRPESKYEINNLLEMMNENPAYKILIHGHTNGNSAGTIITMGETKNYFSLSDTKEGRGSAKKLSEERAVVIKEYLVNQGIAADRMEIKAWGGNRPLYDKNHSLAQSNVRVEIEILEN